MFVISVKSSKKKIIFILAAFIAAIILTVGCFIGKAQSAQASGVNLAANTHEERAAFLSQFGWQIKPEPLEVKEVIIPEEFDEVYTAYNEIQKKQGFDLTAYSSLRVKRWTYEIENYPGYENNGTIRANVLVYDGIVIGGDVCCIKLDGFMHGFEYETLS